MEQIEVQNMESVICIIIFVSKYVRNKICILGLFMYT